MTSEELRKQIIANNEMIEALTNPAQFTLNTLVANLLKENIELQKQCQHEFQNGRCIYCFKEEAK